MILYHRDSLRELGGPGSGNWGHAGIPGQRGGSQKGTGGSSKSKSEPKQKEAKSVKSGFTEEGHYGSGEFSEDQLALVDKYKNYSSNLNGALIKGSGEYADSIDKLDTVIDKSILDRGGLTYSGVGDKFADSLEAMEPGDSFISPAYISTSKDLDVAKEFASSRGMGGKPRIVLEVTNYPGQKGFYFGDKPRGGYDEKELLLPRNEKFMLTNITKKGQYHIYHVMRGA